MRIKFGSLIREYRLKNNLTQLDLSRKLGYDSPQFISLLERDLSKPPIYVLGQLIIHLGISEREILDALIGAYEADVSSELNKGKELATKGG